MTPAQIADDIRLRRDRRLASVLAPHPPAWIVNERLDTDAHTCTFDVILRPALRWERRRYTYDAEVDVLHYRGAEPFEEAGLADLAGERLYQLPLALG